MLDQSHQTECKVLSLLTRWPVWVSLLQARRWQARLLSLVVAAVNPNPPVRALLTAPRSFREGKHTYWRGSGLVQMHGSLPFHTSKLGCTDGPA